VTTKQTATQQRGRLGALDALRLIAAFIVVAFHFTAAHSPGWDGRVPEVLKPVGEWAVYGRLGVPLFFVVSGFVLLMSSWGRDVPSFVASRVGRLFPAYWAAVTFSFVLIVYVWPEGATFFNRTMTTGNGLLNFTMFQEAFNRPVLDGPYWTLWYEARFYALIAVLMLIGMTRARLLAFCALWPIVGSVAQNLHSDLISAALMPDYAPFFAGGMLLYVIYRDGHDLLTWLLVGMNLLFALNFSLDFYSAALPHEVPWPPTKVMLALVTVACFGLVALVTLTPLANLSARWMTLAGALTYPLYLIHQNLGLYIISRVRDDVNAWTAVGLAVGASVIAAVVLHYAIEKPFGPRLRKAVLASLRKTGRPTAEAKSAAAAAAAPSAAVASAAAPSAEVASAAPQPVVVPTAGLQPADEQPQIPLPRVRPAVAGQPGPVPAQAPRVPHHAQVPAHTFAQTLDGHGIDTRTAGSRALDGTRVPDAWATESRQFDDRTAASRVLGDGWGADAWPTGSQTSTREMPAQTSHTGAPVRGAHAAPVPALHPLDEPAVTGQS
jgi:peptidoglycan/LPS O-acetylase OafA/YrhL